MKNILTTIAAVVLVGCATTQQPEPTTAKAPDISILGQVVMEHSRKTEALHFEGSLAVCWSRQRSKEKNQ